jgi:hypothetical protein
VVPLAECDETGEMWIGPDLMEYPVFLCMHCSEELDTWVDEDMQELEREIES